MCVSCVFQIKNAGSEAREMAQEIKPKALFLGIGTEDSLLCVFQKLEPQ